MNIEEGEVKCVLFLFYINFFEIVVDFDFIMEMVIEKSIELKKVKEQHLAKIFHVFNVLKYSYFFILNNFIKEQNFMDFSEVLILFSF